MIVARMVILGVIVLLNTCDYFVGVHLVHVGRAGIKFALAGKNMGFVPGSKPLRQSLDSPG